MSYASGFMVGTSIGKAVYDMFHNKKGKAAANNSVVIKP